ncbi:MAG: peptidoglycan DD-metalloendopeptidase family protein, partial [Myxococcales bacterium]|nr:peptidoglycan DD-metalloendopeptidase family protein [Myxococcales bacterium]
MADRFALPMGDFVAGSYAGRTFWVRNHLGEDHAAPAGTPVRAIANGRIISGGISGAHCNYGMVVVIEHELAPGLHAPDGVSHVVSTYGHLSNRDGLQPRLDGVVQRGDIIGYVGHSGGSALLARCNNDDENGDGAEHLHLGLRLGRHPGSWVYYGYLGSGEDRYPQGRFVSASDFIANAGAAEPPDWWCDALDALHRQGILQRTCTDFSVGDGFNRAEWATVISRSLRLDDSAIFGHCDNPYDDVDPAAWYAPHLFALAGLSYGDGTTVFSVAADRLARPGDPINRCEAVKTIIEAWNPRHLDPPVLRYDDARDIPGWCAPYVEQAAAHGVVSNRAEPFRSGDPVSAGEGATMIANAIDAFGRPRPALGDFNDRCELPEVPPEIDMAVPPPERDMAVAPSERDMAVAPAERDMAVAPPERDMAVAPPERDMAVASPEQDMERPEADQAVSPGPRQDMASRPTHDGGAAPAEVCDGIDQDGDGLTDEGDLCPAGARCVAGICQPVEDGAEVPLGESGASQSQGGCSASAGSASSTPWLILLLLVLWPRRRRLALSLAALGLVACADAQEVVEDQEVSRDMARVAPMDARIMPDLLPEEPDQAPPPDQGMALDMGECEEPYPRAPWEEGTRCVRGESVVGLCGYRVCADLCASDGDCAEGYECADLVNSGSDQIRLCAPPCTDRDGDSTGRSIEARERCLTDCNDNDPMVNIDAAEICDGVDNDCDGRVDVDLELDADAEYLALSCLQRGICEGAEPVCTQGAWRCSYPPDYEESESRCDGVDNDCDGQ